MKLNKIVTLLIALALAGCGGSGSSNAVNGRTVPTDEFSSRMVMPMDLSARAGLWEGVLHTENEESYVGRVIITPDGYMTVEVSFLSNESSLSTNGARIYGYPSYDVVTEKVKFEGISDVDGYWFDTEEASEISLMDVSGEFSADLLVLRVYLDRRDDWVEFSGELVNMSELDTLGDVGYESSDMARLLWEDATFFAGLPGAYVFESPDCLLVTEPRGGGDHAAVKVSGSLGCTGYNFSKSGTYEGVAFVRKNWTCRDGSPGDAVYLLLKREEDKQQVMPFVCQ